jgi:hypothetical protein
MNFEEDISTGRQHTAKNVDCSLNIVQLTVEQTHPTYTFCSDCAIHIARGSDKFCACGRIIKEPLQEDQNAFWPYVCHWRYFREILLCWTLHVLCTRVGRFGVKRN